MIMCVLISMFLLIIGIIGMIFQIFIPYAYDMQHISYNICHNMEIHWLKSFKLSFWENGVCGRFHFHYSAKDFPMITGNLSDVDDIYRRF